MNGKIRSLYEQLTEKLNEIYLIREIGGILEWDMQVMMPKKGITQRSHQQSYIATLLHQKETQKELGALIRDLLSHGEYDRLSPAEKRNILLTQKRYDKLVKVPQQLVGEIAETCSKASAVWQESKKNSDYASFCPNLEKIIELSKRRAEYIAADASCLYDTMLDDFEPGMTQKTYDRLFAELKEGLIALTERILSSPHQPDTAFLERECPEDIQMAIAKDIIPVLGFDMEAGRLDLSAHPFTEGAMDDVRITSRITPRQLFSHFFAVMHETGHGIYEQNLPRAYFHQPAGDSASAGWHESQSLFFENVIGRSGSFWEYYLPRMNAIAGGIFSDIPLPSFLHAINAVHRSPIRIEADEVTYGLHIIMRYEIERDLFSGKIGAKDLKEIWNAKMKEYMDIDISNDSEGILQDIHWSMGAFGYFPTYLLGKVYGAQFLQLAVEKKMPDWQDRIRKGDIISTAGWLKKNIHQKGNLHKPQTLIEEITKEPLSSKYLMSYLNNKFSGLYGLAGDEPTR